MNLTRRGAIKGELCRSPPLHLIEGFGDLTTRVDFCVVSRVELYK